MKVSAVKIMEKSMTNINITIFSHPDCVPKIEVEVEPGTTVSELIEKCSSCSGVTAPLHELLNAWCIVDGRTASPGDTLTGNEKEINIMNQIVGC